MAKLTYGVYLEEISDDVSESHFMHRKAFFFFFLFRVVVGWWHDFDWIMIVEFGLPFPFSCSWIPFRGENEILSQFLVKILHSMAFWMPKICWQRMHAMYADNVTSDLELGPDHRLMCHCCCDHHNTYYYPFITKITILFERSANFFFFLMVRNVVGNKVTRFQKKLNFYQN